MKKLIARILRIILPEPTYKKLLGSYHLFLARAGAVYYGFPSRGMTVIAVTGTKGKSTTVEIIRSILEETGYKTAAASTIRFAIGHESRPNLFKMTMPGRFALQKFLHEARGKGATHVVIEMTSEGAVQFRHKGIDLNALVFINLQPEHLESHGSMEAYAQAKLSLAHHLEQSPKRPRIIVANADDAYGKRFLDIEAEIRAPFSLREADPYTADAGGARFFWRGELWSSPLPGEFNLQNTLAALTVCEALGVPREAMHRAIEKLGAVAGRAERVERGQPFTVVVDYAHTPDSLRALYQTFPGKAVTPATAAGAKRKSKKDAPVAVLPAPEAQPGRRICVLGSTGGGRDKWKRPVIGKIVDEFCDIAVLTDEDPYDENPEEIVDDVASGISRLNPQIIMDRREAMATAFRQAREGDVVLITGKGTDPYIMRARGAKEPWSDKRIAEEELDKLLRRRK